MDGHSSLMRSTSPLFFLCLSKTFFSLVNNCFVVATSLPSDLHTYDILYIMGKARSIEKPFSFQT